VVQLVYLDIEVQLVQPAQLAQLVLMEEAGQVGHLEYLEIPD
jgi:hypothetical protein